MERELQALQQDLARFERRTRLMWLAGLAAVVIVAVLWGGARQAQSQSASLSTRALVLVDQNNRQRIVLSSDTNNRPGIWINDDAGKTRLRFGFGTQPASPLFYLADETERPRVSVGFSVEHGDAQVSLSDPAGTPRAYFGFGVQLRTPQLTLSDERGKNRLYAGWTTGGTAIVDVTDDSGNIIWRSGTAGAGGAAPSTGSPSGGSTGGGAPGSQHKSGAP
ncbi:MAG: hypothetical protein ACYDAB_02260 [bacterium]